MIIVVVLNILILASFKYFNALFPNTSVHLYYVDWFFKIDPINHIIIPIGLSYIIFTVLSYLIEVKRGTILPEKHIGYFSLYVSFFPKIAQGPIERPQNVLKQFHKLSGFNSNLAIEGVMQMTWGYFQKLVIADRLALYVNAVYANVENHNGTTLLLATVFYALQIYADFSGYTDIALGSAKLFGINLTPNFRRPYFSISIQDFWNRWHISFSTWLRDYLFLPLAYFFSRKMIKEKYLFLRTEKWIYFLAIMITFAVCGIWHGEGLHFLIWGLLFGIFLTYSNWSGKFNKSIRKRFRISQSSWYYKTYKIIVTFSLVSFAWIFFRANSTDQAFTILKKIFSTHGELYNQGAGIFIYGGFGLLLLLVYDLSREYAPLKLNRFKNQNPIFCSIYTSILILIVLLIGVFDGSQFIYFQF